MSSNGDLQPKARRAIDHWSRWANGNNIDDGYGTCGFWAYQAPPTPDDPPIRYVVGCKNYQGSGNGLYRGRYASFQPKLVARALSTKGRKADYDEDALPRAGKRHPRRSWLLLFAGPGRGQDPSADDWIYTIDDAWVFDPERVYTHGSGDVVPFTKRSSRDEEVFDIDAPANGVKLGDHLSGLRRPEPTRQPVEAGRQGTFREVLEA